MNTYLDFKKCIELCLSCASVCNYCAASCTKEEDVQMMAKCIQLDMECAAICYLAAQLMSVGSERAFDLCALCADACEACGMECRKHKNEHCKMCATICLECAAACRLMAKKKKVTAGEISHAH